jgi:hypothetical protein
MYVHPFLARCVIHCPTAGWAGSLKSAAMGGMFLALIEGVMFAITRQSPNYESYLPFDEEDALGDEGEQRSWWSSLRFWEKKEGERTPSHDHVEDHHEPLHDLDSLSKESEYYDEDEEDALQAE